MKKSRVAIILTDIAITLSAVLEELHIVASLFSFLLTKMCNLKGVSFFGGSVPNKVS